MSEELGTRDVVEQLDTRLGNLEQGQRDLRGEIVTRFAGVDSRFAHVDSRFDQLHGELERRFDQLRGELDRRFGRLNAMMVTVLLAVVFGFGGLWLK